MTDPATLPPPRSAFSVRSFLLGAGAGLIVGLVMVGSIVGTVSLVNSVQQAGAAAGRQAILSDAVKKCGLANNPNAQIGDGGYSLTINMKGTSDLDGVSDGDESCVINALHAPEAVKSHIGQTTSLDGRQTESWGNITMSWSYHPSRGLDSVFTVTHQ